MRTFTAVIILAKLVECYGVIVVPVSEILVHIIIYQYKYTSMFTSTLAAISISVLML